MRTIFYATTVTALIAAIAACSDNTDKGDAGPGGQICPTTIQQATKTGGGAEGTSNMCHVDQYICVVGFQCGNFTQQATCTCTIPAGETALRFQCLLSNGQEVDPDTTDSTGLCKSINPDASADPCPTDKTKAEQTPCSTAGEVCTYTTTCTSSPPPQDVCQCKGLTSGDPGLAWHCELNQCP
jgi:hypothetical protein